MSISQNLPNKKHLSNKWLLQKKIIIDSIFEMDTLYFKNMIIYEDIIPENPGLFIQSLRKPLYSVFKKQKGTHNFCFYFPNKNRLPSFIRGKWKLTKNNSNYILTFDNITSNSNISFIVSYSFKIIRLNKDEMVLVLLSSKSKAKT